jgi:hypothetical protein
VNLFIMVCAFSNVIKQFLWRIYYLYYYCNSSIWLVISHSFMVQNDLQIGFIWTIFYFLEKNIFQYNCVKKRVKFYKGSNLQNYLKERELNYTFVSKL